MKQKFFLLFIIAFTIFSPVLGQQVGINTENPTATLDVNGNLKVRSVKANSASKNVLILSADSLVQTNKAENLFPQKQGLYSAVKYQASANYVLNLSLLQGWGIIPFSEKVFDVRGDYNATTYQYTVPGNGIYIITAQFKAAAALGVGTAGVGIVRVGTGEKGTDEILSQQSNLGVTLIGIPTIVNTFVIPDLIKGQIIYFVAKVPLLSVGLLGGSDAYFSIIQVQAY